MLYSCFGLINGSITIYSYYNVVIFNIEVISTENVTSFTHLLGSVTAGSLGFTFIIYSLLIVAGIWIIYLIIFLTVKIVKKIKNRKGNSQKANICCLQKLKIVFLIL